MKLLIDKFLNNTISTSELDALRTWLHDKKNQIEFKNYIRELSDINVALQDIDFKLAHDSVLKNIHKAKKPVKQLYTQWFKYAAIGIMFLGLGYLYQGGYFTKDSKLIIPNESITLQLENGNIQILKEDGSTKIVDAKGKVIGGQNGNQLTYDEQAIDKETLVYNTLTIPYGKRFKIQLSDGTMVNLNSGTSLKYPVKFIEGENRQVFLNGEAYFSVAKDAEHPFIVNANNINVRVLGTQFNISSYPEDELINTVLVEGAVSVYEKETPYNKETATKLEPGFNAAWVKNSNKFIIEEADIEMYTAWINGKVIFRYMTFENIIKKLERHYNVVIINNNESLNKERFAATFDIETIEEVLESFNKNYQINYSIENNLITIN